MRWCSLTSALLRFSFLLCSAEIGDLNTYSGEKSFHVSTRAGRKKPINPGRHEHHCTICSLRSANEIPRSMQSRAAARLRLQKIVEVGKGSSECICFPEDEQPFFRTSEESDLAEGVQCPVHGERVTPRFHIFVAAWRWENEVKFRWPRLSAQYHKAWAASFPPDL